MPNNSKDDLIGVIDLIERGRIIPLDRVAELTSLSVDSLKRNHRDKIRQLGPRRVGMRLADALNIGLERTPTAITRDEPKTA